MQLLGKLSAVQLALVTQSLLLCYAVLVNILFQVLPPLHLWRRCPGLWLPGLLELFNRGLQVRQ